MFAAPFNAPALLKYDTELEQLSHVNTEAVYSGNAKWDGITVLGDKIYAVPFDARTEPGGLGFNQHINRV